MILNKYCHRLNWVCGDFFFFYEAVTISWTDDFCNECLYLIFGYMKFICGCDSKALNVFPIRIKITTHQT